jgi:SAM-dependent methyltransferase
MHDSKHNLVLLDRGVERRRKLEQRLYWDMTLQRPDTHWKTLKKMLAEPHYAGSVIRKHLHFALPRGGPLLTTDRLVLEQQLFPYYQSQSHIQDVLFVGCDADTAHYETTYFDHARFVTLEPDPANRKFGAAHHVEAPLESLVRHFPPESFDLIICNGVFGWGLNELQACEAAFGQCHTCLRRKGQLLVGWNDVPTRAQFPLERIRSLARFRRYEFPLLGTWRYRTDTAYRHVFDFYMK